MDDQQLETKEETILINTVLEYIEVDGALSKLQVSGWKAAFSKQVSRTNVEARKWRLERSVEESRLDILRILRGWKLDPVKSFDIVVEIQAWYDKYDKERKIWKSLELHPYVNNSASGSTSDAKWPLPKEILNKNIEFYLDVMRLPHFDKIKKVYPERFYHGFDRHGNVITVTNQPMIHNLTGLMTQIKPEEYLEFRTARSINQNLLLRDLSFRDGRMTKLVVIWDLHGMTQQHWSKLQSVPAVKFFANFDQEQKDIFPESVHKVICVNAPRFLTILWSILRHMLPERTANKVALAPPQKSLKELGEFVSSAGDIDLSMLPRCLGGTCPVDETKSRWFFGNEYFAEQKASDSASEDDSKNIVEKITIDPGKMVEFPVKLLPCESAMWGMQLQGHDLVLDIAFEEDSATPSQPVYFAKGKSINSSEFESGSHALTINDVGGSIVFRFDNRKSMFRSKTIELNVVISSNKE